MCSELNMRRHLLWFILVMVGCGQVALIEANCEASTCRECIASRNMCVWCSSETFELDNRCRPASEINNAWCPPKYIHNPKGEVTIEESKSFSSSPGHSVQLKPQKFHLNLRVGELQTFNFSYKSVEDYPVDIYFLLDASKSMTEKYVDLQEQSEMIHNTMKNLTNDVYFGLGTFSDKNIVPFNDEPMSGTVYSFKHHLNLSQDLEAFRKTLIKLSINLGKNYDNPESGLDGIAQVIACKDRIKWREQSRKILVFMTDANYHVAGDGKLAGIIQPYDGECHLDKKGLYYMAEKMDYPSLGHINKLAAAEQIVLFVFSELRDSTVYSELRFAVSGSFYTKSEKEITKSLKEIYEKITETIDLRVSTSFQELKYLSITFEPNCQSEQGSSEACSVEKGEEKHFTGTIMLDKYSGVDKFNTAINPKGLKENIMLNVNVITNCDCDKRSVENSTKCNNVGKWSCGVCECLKDKHGPTCSCSNSVSECKRGKEKDCSGHGFCICGICNCNQGYGGKFCQHLVDNCQRGGGLELCSGHGSCRDGRCECYSGYEGDACECPTSEAACMKNKQECNNRGKCQCGKCTCDAPAAWDIRPRDELCTLMTPQYEPHLKQCRSLIPCEECLQRGGDCSATCGDKIIVIDHDIPEDLRSKWHYCSNVRVDFGCYANYSYIYNDNDTITLFVLHERSCTESQILFGVISLVVLVAVGLATLVAWKLLMGARDRREYEQFKKALEAEEQVEVNAMYKEPCTTYRNPAFECHQEELH